MKLRDYQTSAVEAVFEAWQKFKRVLVVLPTGCGKTVVFASVIGRLLSGGGQGADHPNGGEGRGKRSRLREKSRNVAVRRRSGATTEKRLAGE